jgi:predicted metalloprotease with PDZ domain
VIEPVAARYVAMMPPEPGQAYLVVLLPVPENGGESFRNSFAMNLAQPPARGNRLRWGNTLAHELFHYWNGWRLRGEDYAATQWFQEGFTEYVANQAALAAGAATPAEFMDQLARHVGNYRRLESTLAAPGTRKGPPLYSGGALVALAWDVLLRRGSGGQRDLDDVFGALWQATGQGARPYAWADIQAALERTAPGAWEEFHRRHVAGREPLPVAATLQALGLKLTGDGSQAQPLRVVPDPAAPASAQAAWEAFILR